MAPHRKSRGQNGLLSLTRNRIAAIVAFSLAFTFAAAALGEPSSAYDNINTAEGWAWSQIKQASLADFNKRCRPRLEELDPKNGLDPAWVDENKCRTIPATFIIEILSRPELRDAVPYRGVRIIGAKVVGDLKLDGLEFSRPVGLEDSRFEGAILLTVARAKNVVDLHGSCIVGELDAYSFHSENDFDLSGTEVEGKLNAARMQVAGSLLMNSDKTHQASFQNVRLDNANVTGTVDMTSTHVDGELNADSLKVGGSIFMRTNDGASYRAHFHGVNLTQANVNGRIEFSNASIDGDVYAEELQVGGVLSFIGSSFNNVVDLSYASVRGPIVMTAASLTGDLVAEHITVGGSLGLRNIVGERARFLLPLAQIGGNLTLVGARISELDLHGASVVGEMTVGDKTAAAAIGLMDLRNAHVGSLSDNALSWGLDPGRATAPRRLHLDGFAFAQLGGSTGSSGAEMVDRGADWWDRWARLDVDRSSTPYEQLATAFVGLGDRGTADDIRYAEQISADEKLSNWGSIIWSRFLRWVAGYGIGSYMFRALGWALGLSLLGAVVLRFSVKGVTDKVVTERGVARTKHGIVWCFGAAVNQLLPVVTLKKEFKDFFDDREINKFRPWQDFVFTMLAVLGWALGLIVLAAMATITHGA